MSNTSRGLTQVVSVDGWIATFDAENTATVHADVVFREGRFGAEDSNKVRFQLTLARAEVVLIIPDSEPLRIVRGSMDRTLAIPAKLREVTRETSTEARGVAEVGVSAAVIPQATLSARGEARHIMSMREQSTEMTSGVLVQHFTAMGRHPAWEIRPLGRDDLQGVPWDARVQPRLSVKRIASRNNDGDEPTMRIEVRCRREDILISNLQLKDPKKQSLFKLRPNRDVNLAAAEQVIKEELLSAGFFHVPNMREEYAELVIADFIISEDW